MECEVVVLLSLVSSLFPVENNKCLCERERDLNWNYKIFIQNQIKFFCFIAFYNIVGDGDRLYGTGKRDTNRNVSMKTNKYLNFALLKTKLYH